MEISLTKLPWFRNVRVTAFDSNEKVCWAAHETQLVPDDLDPASLPSQHLQTVLWARRQELRST